MFMFGPVHATYTAEQLQEIKGRDRKEGDTRVHCCTHPYKKDALSLRGTGCLMKEHLARERPKPAEPSQSCCICTETTQQ